MSTGIVRRLAEIVLGPLVIRRHLPSESGGGVIHASGKVGGMKFLLKPSRKLDPELLGIARLLVRKGQVIWDVGTNVGLFSRASAFHAGSAGKVISIEADVDAIALLNRTSLLQSADHAPMTVVPVAVSDSTGFVRFSIAKRARAANAIEGYGSTQTGGIAETRTLPCVTLDALLVHFSPPDVLKIDVEGAELSVLRGGERMLSEVRPVIYCEVSSAACDEVTHLLRDRSYRMWDGQGFDGSMRPEIAIAAGNTVAIPEERVCEVFMHQ